MEYLLLFLKVFEILILIYLGFTAIYLFIFSLAGLFRRKVPDNGTHNTSRIAVLIPSYKEDAVIVEVAEEALKQDYKKSLYDVVIIADSLKPETLDTLRKLPVKLIEVSFEKSTKSKALNKAMSQLPDNYYDIAVILDADNVMESDFLSRINRAFSSNLLALQGHRVAKNLNNHLAILDALSEEINNHIFRAGHRTLGLSAALIGSGMAFNYDFFKDMMLNVKAIGGFDKEIELKMLKEGHTIEYLHDALILDEKVSHSDVFSNQRRRWLSAQIHYARSISDGFKHLILKGNFDYFDKALQMVLPPRVILLGFISIFTVMAFIFNSTLLSVWLTVVAVTFLAFLFAIPAGLMNIRTLKSLFMLPMGFILMVKSLLKTKGANKQFIHTQHASREKLSK